VLVHEDQLIVDLVIDGESLTTVHAEQIAINTLGTEYIDVIAVSREPCLCVWKQ
jgi:pyrimidine deaminase RibD-like protein